MRVTALFALCRLTAARTRERVARHRGDPGGRPEGAMAYGGGAVGGAEHARSRGGGVGEDEAAALDGVDHRLRVRLGERRAAPAPADACRSCRACSSLTYQAPCITMCRSSARSLTPAIQSLELERVAVAALVGVAGQEQAEARGPAVVDVREVGGVLVAAAGAVGHQLVEQHLPACEVEHPEPRLGRGEGVVDDRQPVVPCRRCRGRERRRPRRAPSRGPSGRAPAHAWRRPRARRLQ